MPLFLHVQNGATKAIIIFKIHFYIYLFIRDVGGGVRGQAAGIGSLFAMWVPRNELRLSEVMGKRACQLGHLAI